MANVSVLLFESRNLEEKQTTTIIDDETGRGRVASTNEKDSSEIIRIIVVVITTSCRFLEEEKHIFDTKILEFTRDTHVDPQRILRSYVQFSMQLRTRTDKSERR